MTLPAPVRTLLEYLEDGLPEGTLALQDDLQRFGYFEVDVDLKHAIQVGQRAHDTGWTIAHDTANSLMLTGDTDSVFLQVWTPLTVGSQALADTLVTWDAQIDGGLASLTPLAKRCWTSMPTCIGDLPRAFTDTLLVEDVLPVATLQKVQTGQFGTRFAATDPVAQTLAVLLDDTTPPGERLAFHLINVIARHFLTRLDEGTNLLETARALTAEQRPIVMPSRPARTGRAAASSRSAS